MSRARYPCAIFAGALSYEFLPRGGLPSAAGLNLPLTRGLLSERDNKVRGRNRCLKSTKFTPRREDFQKGKICGETFSHIISTSKTTLLRCGTQFASYQRLIVREGQQGAWAKPLLKINKVYPSPRRFPEGKDLRRNLFPYYFREQNHAFALRDTICTRRALIALRMTTRRGGDIAS